MATVINNPGNRDDGGGAGWAVSVIILLVVIAIGAYVWTHYSGSNTTIINPPAAQNGTGANTGTAGNTLNVTLPGTTGSSSTGGSASTTTRFP